MASLPTYRRGTEALRGYTVAAAPTDTSGRHPVRLQTDAPWIVCVGPPLPHGLREGCGPMSGGSLHKEEVTWQFSSPLP